MHYSWDRPLSKQEEQLITFFQCGTPSPQAWREMAVCILNAQGEWGPELIETILQEMPLAPDEDDRER